MPGLSSYSPYRPVDDPESRILSAPDPTLSMGWDEEPAGLRERMEQRLQELMGFADPKQTAAELLFHGMSQNVPGSELDKTLYPAESSGRISDPTTFREIMDRLKLLSPLNTIQGQ
jgi:hypothetical protein